MQITNLETILRQHAFFKDLKDEYVNFVTGCAKNVRFKADEVILKEGGPADYFYLIREGMVAIEILLSSHNPVTIQTIQGGEILGWSWLIPPHRSRFNCHAVNNVRAIALDGKCLREKCEKDHDLGYELLKRLTNIFTKRLEATRIQLLDIYGRK